MSAGHEGNDGGQNKARGQWLEYTATTTKNGGHSSVKIVHDSFKHLMVPNEAHILS